VNYVDFEALMPTVLQQLFNEGVDESSFNKNRALYAIRSAYIEFVKKANLIRRTITLTGQANVNEYPLYKIDEQVIKKIYSVVVGDQCYDPGQFCVCNCCKNHYNYQDGFLSLCSAPECDGISIEVCASVFPSSVECKMEERIYELYGYEIASGAVYNLLSKAVSAPAQAIYDAGIHRASSEAAKSWSRTVYKKKQRWVRR
jgi:hypothetical protein